MAALNYFWYAKAAAVLPLAIPKPREHAQKRFERRERYIARKNRASSDTRISRNYYCEYARHGRQQPAASRRTGRSRRKRRR